MTAKLPKKASAIHSGSMRSRCRVILYAATTCFHFSKRCPLARLGFAALPAPIGRLGAGLGSAFESFAMPTRIRRAGQAVGVSRRESSACW